MYKAEFRVMYAMTEQSIHEQLKEIYAQDSGKIESPLGDYRVDVLNDELLIEIQTGSFYSIRDKLRELARKNKVKLVYPISQNKWIVRLDKDGNQLSRRKSPKKGKIEDIFNQLVYMPELLADTNLELEVLLIDAEEIWFDDGKGSWRRRRWSIKDRKMLQICSKILFQSPEDLKPLIPDSLSSEFTSKMLASEAGINKRLAQKMLYCLTKMKVVERNGKKARLYLYKIC